MCKLQQEIAASLALLYVMATPGIQHSLAKYAPSPATYGTAGRNALLPMCHLEVM